MATSATTFTFISISISTPKPLQPPTAILPRQVITQTLTYADRTTTALVTLGPGAAAPAPAPASDSGSSSNGVSSAIIGIVIGSLVGAVVLGLLLWVCCSIRRRMLEQAIREHEDAGDDIIAYETGSTTTQVPQRAYYGSYWPRFPMSIPPPVVPTYRAVPPETLYTASASGRGRTQAQAQAPASYGFYEYRVKRK